MVMVRVEQNLTHFFDGNQDRFFFIVLIFDLMYPMVAFIQSKMMGSYPGRRFRQTLPDAISIYMHIVAGFLSIYGLSIVFLLERYGPDNFIDDADLFIRFMGLCMLIHTMTSFYMLPIVHGEKVITQPLYAGQICINLVDSIQAIRDPTYNNAMLLYGAVNAFVLVRMFYMTLVAYTFIDRKLLYTFAITSSFVSPVLAGHDMVWLSMYGFPGVYGAFVFIYRSIPRAETFSNMKENLMQAPSDLRTTNVMEPAAGIKTPAPAMAFRIGDEIGSNINTAPKGIPEEDSPWAPLDRLIDDSYDSNSFNGPEIHVKNEEGANYDGPDHLGPRAVFGKPATRMTLGAVFLFALLMLGFLVSTIILAVKDHDDGKCRPYTTELTDKDPVDFVGTLNGQLKAQVGQSESETSLARNQAIYAFTARNVTSFTNRNGLTFLFGTLGGPVGAFQREMDKQNFALEVLPSQLLDVLPAINATLQRIPSMKISKLTDYDQMFLHGFPPPRQDAQAILKDDQFAYEQTTITGGYTEKAYIIPKVMQGKLSEADVNGLLPPNTTSLADAMAKGFIYQVDLQFIDKIGPHNRTSRLFLTPGTEPRAKYTIGVVGLFAAHNFTHPHNPLHVIKSKLMPLAIWLGAGSDIVFTPNDAEVEWIMAKLYFANSAKIVSHSRHVVIDHMLQEPYLVAAKRQLPERHPVYRIIKYHAYLSMGIVEFVTDMFLSATAIDDPFSVDQILGVGGNGLARLVAKDYEIFNYENYDPETDFQTRDAHGLPNYHYRDDNLALFFIIEKFIRGYVELYYDSDEDVERDSELQEWTREMSSMELGRVKGFPVHITSITKLARVLGRYCWRTSIHHSSNSGENAYEYLSHPGAMVSSMYMKPPTAKGRMTWDTLWSAMPTPEEGLYKMGILRCLKRPMKPDESILYAYSSGGLGPQAEHLIRKFQQDMLKYSKFVQARKKKQEEDGWIPGPAYGLDPASIPFWGWL